MEVQSLKSSYPGSNSFPRRRSHKTCYTWTSQKSASIYYLNRTSKIDFAKLRRRRKELLRALSCKRSFMRKAGEEEAQLIDNSTNDKKGTVAGAIALIVGTSIGSGILAFPKKTSPAGFIPSAICVVLCWGFLLIEALLLAEINVGLRNCKKRRGEEDDRVEIISVRTMAQETLGNWGGNLVTITYIFLAYTTMVAYTSKSGEILSNLTSLPKSISGIFFTVLFTLLISIGGVRVTDWINQWMTASMIGLLVVIEVIGAAFGGWSGMSLGGDWHKVPFTIPVIIFSLVYHDIAPVLCSYLGGDLSRIRLSFVLGSLIPLVALLVWDAVALGLSKNADGVDPMDLLLQVEWSGVPAMVEAFSLLAVGTSLIGTMLGFFQFFEEQLNNLTFPSLGTKSLQEKWEGTKLWKRWRSNGVKFTISIMVAVPTVVISTTVPDAFSAATDIAGGYCMTVLYGVLPPAMAWALHAKSCDVRVSNGKEYKEEDDHDKALISTLKPALVGAGLFACGVVAEQILQDLSLLHP